MKVQENKITRDEELSMAHDFLSEEILNGMVFKNFEEINKTEIALSLSGNYDLDKNFINEKERIATYLIVFFMFFLNFFTFMFLFSV